MQGPGRRGRGCSGSTVGRQALPWPTPQPWSFPAVVPSVLQRPHLLQGDHLDVSLHYDFLEPSEQEQGGPSGLPEDSHATLPLEAATRQLLESEFVLQQLRLSFPECTVQLDGSNLHVSGTGREQLLVQVQAALQGVVQEHLPFSSGVLDFLRREDVQRRLAELLVKQKVEACYVPGVEEMMVVALNPPAARQAAALLEASLCTISLPLSELHLLALASPRWAQLQAGLRCCVVRLAESGEHLEGLTLPGLEEENLARLADFLQDSVPDEVVVPMEATTLRYLQVYRSELLAGMTSLTLLPLEGPDVTGLRVSPPLACGPVCSRGRQQRPSALQPEPRSGLCAVGLAARPGLARPPSSHPLVMLWVEPAPNQLCPVPGQPRGTLQSAGTWQCSEPFAEE